MIRFRIFFWSAAADLIHGIRYLLIPALDFCWRKRDAAQLDRDFGDEKA